MKNKESNEIRVWATKNVWPMIIGIQWNVPSNIVFDMMSSSFIYLKIKW